MLQLNIIIPDVHWPKHDPEAVACLLAAMRVLKPHRAVFLGDALEVDQFSRHGKKSITEEERRDWEADMDGFDDGVLGPVCKLSREQVIIEGNHEYRVESAAMDSPAIRSVLSMISPRVRFTRRRSVTWVPYQAPTHLSHYAITRSLWAVHGWSHSKNAATAHLAKCSSFSLWHGHTHRNQSDSKRDPATGRMIRAMCPGFLGTLQPVWRGSDPTNWSHGFGLTWADPDTDEHWSFTCEIDRGTTILPNGKRLSA